MNKLIKITVAAVLPAAWAAGCSDFLKGGDLNTSPNNPVKGSASSNQLFVSIQANMYVYQESDMGRAIAQWTQQLYGAARQQVGIYDYSGVDNSTYDGEFIRPYDGGGLLDLRTLEQQTGAAGDKLYLGIAQTMEAWFIGSTADVWGDIPYTQAANYATYPTPKLDPQQEVYDSVESLLSQAITNMTAATGGGPGGADLAYGGDKASWVAFAHTLKARYYLHQARGVGGTSMYTAARTEAQSGISSQAGDYIAFHDGSLQLSSNLWWQFMSSNGGTGRALDLVASTGAVNSTLWNMLVAAADPRFAEYFNPANAADGAMNANRLAAGFPQPFVTYIENQLILAETNLVLGSQAAADAAYDNARAAWGTKTAWHSARALPARVGSVTNSQIMTEKYISLFQNVEVWNDWKRTGCPALTVVPPGTSVFGGGAIPRRMLYGLTEQQTNPNIPAPGSGSNGLRNWNDPTPNPVCL